jgi:hypothetical protein
MTEAAMSSASARVGAPHLAGREHRLFRDLESRQSRHGTDRLDVDEISRREHDIGKALRHVNGLDACVR